MGSNRNENRYPVFDPAEFANFEIRQEGTIKFHSFSPEKYANNGKALKKSMPVFYNPTMVINRDITMVAYKAFQNLNPKMLRDEGWKVCDSMAASGIRAMRLQQYLNPPLTILANDLNGLAIKMMERNFALNELLGAIKPSHDECQHLFHQLRLDRVYQTIIDIDPFGSPNVVVDGALKAISPGGLLAVTATDTAVLFGVKKEACVRKYNARCLRSTFLKEVGLRILIHFCDRRAHPLERYVVPLLSFSSDHYVRVFLKVLKGKKGIDQNLDQSGYLLWCPKCDWRSSTGLDWRGAPSICPRCGEKIDFGGPLWLGPLHDAPFVQECVTINEATSKEIIPGKKRLQKLLPYMVEEADFPPHYYNLHRICDRLTLSVGKTKTVFEEIKERGYRCARTHIESRAIKSTIPLGELEEIMTKLHEISLNES